MRTRPVRPHVPAGRGPVYHLYVVRVRDRARVQQRLAAAGIGTGIHYPSRCISPRPTRASASVQEISRSPSGQPRKCSRCRCSPGSRSSSQQRVAAELLRTVDAGRRIAGDARFRRRLVATAHESRHRSSGPARSSSRRPRSAGSCASSTRRSWCTPGQHYDYEMSGIFFDGLEHSGAGREPRVGSGSHGAQTGAMLTAHRRRADAERPGLAARLRRHQLDAGRRAGRRQSCACRSRTSKRGCAASIAGCQRRSTASSPIICRTCCSARATRRCGTSRPRASRATCISSAT